MDPRDQREGAKVSWNRCITRVCQDRASREDNDGYRGRCIVYTFPQRDTSRFKTEKWYIFLSAKHSPTVLYSCEKQVWKIADFGLTVSGTSSQAYSTRYSRGSSSYRAPELINNGKYNNKADIWAIGCILVEVLFQQKAFDSDFAVFQYATSRKNFQIPLDNPFPEKLKGHISSLVHDTLNVNPSNRPSAHDLLTRFQSVLGDESDLDFDSETLETMEVSLEVLKKSSQLRSVISRFDGQESIDQFLCLGTGKSGSVYCVFPIFLTRLIPDSRRRQISIPSW